MSTHNLCFEQTMKNYYKSFLPENFQFLEVKFSIYLNRRVFIMGTEISLVEQTCSVCIWMIFSSSYLYNAEFKRQIKAESLQIFPCK